MSELRKPVPQEATRRKEPMSDAEIGDLLAAIGNHEGKALLLAAMQPNERYTGSRLHRLIGDRQGEHEKWKGMSRSLPFNWCEWSLAPIGLVAKGDGISGYQKTEKGEEIGQALAGHLLDFSERHPDISLYQLFGTTSSPSKRSVGEEREQKEEQVSKLRGPLTKLRLFTELTTSSLPIRETDVTRALYNDYPVEYAGLQLRQTLESLSKNNILSYKAIKQDKSFSFYKLSSNSPDDNPTAYISAPLTKEIFTILKDVGGEAISLKGISDELRIKYPEKGKQGLYTHTATILKHFEREGYVERVGGFGHGRQSEINITDEQGETLIDLVTLIERFREGDPEFLEEGKRKAAEIVGDPERFAALLEKAKKSSSNANQTDLVETSTKLEAIIVENGESSRADLQDAFFERYGRSLQEANLNRILKSMRKSGDIEAVKKGSKLYYSPVQKEESFESAQQEQGLPPEGTIFQA